MRSVFAPPSPGRGGGGPSYLHLRVPIFHGHYEGDPETYRAPGEVARLRAEADCIPRLRAAILDQGRAPAATLDALAGRAAAEATDALRQAEAAPFPALATLTADVLARGGPA